jgi:hypothetical protein
MKRKNPFTKANRESAKQQGYFDGRFRSRVVQDKKKQLSKTAARKKPKQNEN